MRFLVLSILALSSLSQAQESAQYLHNAIKDLRYMKGRQTLKRVDTTAVQAIVPDPEPTSAPAPAPKAAERRMQGGKSVPPLSLTKGELAALYEAAVSKGETVKLNTGDNSYIHAAVHEMSDSPSYDHETKAGSGTDVNEGDDGTGYYYYYYPVKSFLDDMASQSTSHDYQYSSTNHKDTKHTSEKPHYHQYHSHTHQHNKALEPLFMAISGFIGMAVMFVLSVLVFPKFGIKKTRGNIKGGIKKNERITDIARVALQAIEGKDCAERFACELEKTARAFNLQDNRFVKLLKRMAPSSFGKQMDKVGRYNNKRLRCTAIPCKKKNPPKKKAGTQKKP
ncbi:hypothetical protein TcasGA2_TC004298 [Tribolium castaneum]|uniref:Uncharacterized protein n=1 Tax=Tribolium castaneum TaxID=7070 RepID=D7EL54_TRICA|nr:hypothetical protein TcasGA2_TC004298 [Tribolium castaneum]